ncbi:WPP domain-associated protein [Heracleum sosnowskyi]|uniref:WPP domain-associated protein n=1 Tax=Heracleum sosnowskyi TaxID=360622 RepID=A0AAD8HKQ1_9APIA|nr:WPP domain-associated protein [Heracleum sosnowskyi]
MESQEVLDNVIVSNGSVASLGSGVKGSGDVDVDFLDDLDSYWEAVNERMFISRMVSDSVTKGMVNGVEQLAADKVAAKELELANLKRSLSLSCGGVDRVGFCEPEIADNWKHLSLTNGYVEHDKMRESFISLKCTAREQLDNLKKEIDGIRGCNSVKKISSSPELVGLSGILVGKENESWIGVDTTVDVLNVTVENIFKHFDNMLNMSNISLSELRQEQEFQKDVEGLVMRSVIVSSKKEYEEKLQERKVKFCQSQSEDWLDKFNEISNLRKELEVVVKLLGSHETEQLVSYASVDSEHSHRKGLNNLMSVQTTHREGNGFVDGPEADLTDLFDASRFKHMDRDELEKHVAIMMRNSKRDHESIVQRMTEKYFNLKAKYLNKIGPSLPIRKDKEFDILKRKVAEVILKIDDTFADNENLHAFSVNTFSCFKDGVERILLENRELKNFLTEKNDEVNSLSSQVSEAAEKFLQHSLSEEIFSCLLANLSSSMEDASNETFVREEVYKCVLKELSGHIIFNPEKLESKSFEHSHRCQPEDSDIELLIMQQIGELALRESMKDATRQLKELYQVYLIENKNRVSLEMEGLESEENLRLEVVENEKLKQEAVSMAALMEEKDKFAKELSVTLMKKTEQFDLYSQELIELRDSTKKQQQKILDTCLEFDQAKCELKKALEQIEVNEMEIKSLRKHIELQMQNLEDAKKLQKAFDALSEVRQNDLLLLKEKEKAQREQMQALILFADGMSKQFTQWEHRVAKDINLYYSRLVYSKSQLDSLVEKASVLTKAGLQYKQKLEKRCSDLRTAEAEVDLLGDEVEELLGLLEKIYIALDHYSPVLQHYPGIIEILKVVRRELSGETSKSV